MLKTHQPRDAKIKGVSREIEQLQIRHFVNLFDRILWVSADRLITLQVVLQ